MGAVKSIFVALDGSNHLLRHEICGLLRWLHLLGVESVLLKSHVFIYTMHVLDGEGRVVCLRLRHLYNAVRMLILISRKVALGSFVRERVCVVAEGEVLVVSSTRVGNLVEMMVQGV
jgi:hypothetical protein